MAKNQNERGLRRSRETTSSTSPVGKNYLFAIAIDAYQNFPKLYNCVKDAKDIIDILTDKYQFEEENVYTLFNEEATTSGIFTKFESLAGKIKAIDNLIIYFAGHGEFKKVFNEGYWIPVDARDNSVGQYIPNSEIKTMLTAVKTQHTFLIADSCFSGSLFQRGNHRNVVRRRIERFPSRWGLTSGRSEIVGDGTPGENSPFAKSILYLLKNNLNPLSVQELCAHVTETVEANATQTPIGEPLNIPGHQGGQFVFHLKKNEQRDWLAAKETHTADAYEGFITMYPQGMFLKEAETIFEKLKEEEEWELAIHANTIQGFLIYKKQYPEGKFVDEAIAKIGGLEEEKEWSKISRRNRLSDYLKYVRDYPLGKYVDEANAKIALLDVKGTTEKEIKLDTDIDENWEETIEDELEDLVVKPDEKEKKKPVGTPTLFPKSLMIGIPILAALIAIGIYSYSSKSIDNNTISEDEIVENTPEDFSKDIKLDDVVTSVETDKVETITPPQNEKVEEPKKEAPNPAPKVVERNNNQAECDRIMVKANQQFQSRDFAGAYSNYESAKRKCNDLTWSKLSACKDGIQFNTFKRKADQFYRQGDYSQAKTAYRNALSYFSRDQYCKDQIKICEANLKPKPPQPNPTPTDSRPAAVSNFERDMVFVGKGTFQMGSERGDEDERPVHTVTIDKNFYMAKYEVTQELWKAVMGKNNNPSKNAGCDQCPVESVTFNEIQTFIKKLNEITGKQYRLPTEAEWEYAARGGKQQKHKEYPGTSPNACAVFSTSSPRPVGKKAKNALGLYDMAGNVSEWCVDWYDEDYYNKSRNAINPIQRNSIDSRRVTRGGNFQDESFQLRVSNRIPHTTSRKRNLHLFGFRLVR